MVTAHKNNKKIAVVVPRKRPFVGKKYQKSAGGTQRKKKRRKSDINSISINNSISLI